MLKTFKTNFLSAMRSLRARIMLGSLPFALMAILLICTAYGRAGEAIDLKRRALEAIRDQKILSAVLNDAALLNLALARKNTGEQNIDINVFLDALTSDMAKAEKPPFKALTAAWEELRARIASNRTVTAQDVQSFMKNAKNLIVSLSDSSRLSVDPDPEARSLIDAQMRILPHGLDLIGEIGGALYPVLPAARGNAETGAQAAPRAIAADAAIYARLLAAEEYSARGVAPEFEKSIRPFADHYIYAGAMLAKVLNAMAESGGMTQQTFLIVWKNALDSTYALSIANAGALEKCLETRIDEDRRRRTQTLIFSLAWLAVCAALSQLAARGKA